MSTGRWGAIETASTPGRSSGPHRPTLLVLTGTIDETIAAVSCGAQAVGFAAGIGSDDRPSGPDGSDSCYEMVRWATHYCRVRGVQVYGILNSPADPDTACAESSAEAALYRTGAEYAVVNSLGALGAAKQVFPDWPIWAGRSLAVHNADSVVDLEQAGVSGVFLPPELTAGEIAEIAGRTCVQLAAFVHQERCAFYAGHCVSPGALRLGAGAGECDHWCRHGYTLEPGEASAPGKRRAKRRVLKPGALEALPILRELVGAGINCLAVDGAFRGPEHVAIVTDVYRAALGRLARAPGSFAATASEMSLLALASGDEPSTRSEEQANAEAGARARIAAGPPRIPVRMRATARIGAPLRLELADSEGHTVTVSGSASAEAARTAPLSYEYLHRQLSRLGDTPFVLESLRCELDGAAIVPVSDISDIRRRAARALELARATPREQQIREDVPVPWLPDAGPPAARLEVAVRVSGVEGATVAAEAGASLICIGGEAFVPQALPRISEIEDAARAAHRSGAKLYYATSRIVHDREMNAVREGLRRAADLGADGFLIASLGLVSFAAQLTPDAVVADWSLGIADPFGWSLLSTMGAAGFIIPPWLGLDRACMLAERLATGGPQVFAFGRVELGVSEYCVVDSVLGGRSGRRACSAPCMRGPFSLCDSVGHIYPIRCDRSCRMHVFDCDELDLIDSLPRFRRAGLGRVWLDLRGEPASRVAHVSGEYVRAAHRALGDPSS